MDVPIISQSILHPKDVTKPVVAGIGAGAINPESHTAGNPLLKNGKDNGSRQPREGKEQVDISALARLLSRGLSKIKQ